MNELETRLIQIEEQLEEVNTKLKGHNALSKTAFKKLKIQKKKLLKEKEIILKQIVASKDLWLIDNSSYSWVSDAEHVGKKLKRYFKNKYNKLNFAIVFNPFTYETYIINHPNTQLTKRVVMFARRYLEQKYGNNIILASDKRNTNTLTLGKPVTNIIKLRIAQIKNRVYAKIREIGRENLTLEQFLKLYNDRFKELGIEVIANL